MDTYKQETPPIPTQLVGKKWPWRVGGVGSTLVPYTYIIIYIHVYIYIYIYIYICIFTRNKISGYPSPPKPHWLSQRSLARNIFHRKALFSLKAIHWMIAKSPFREVISCATMVTISKSPSIYGCYRPSPGRFMAFGLHTWPIHWPWPKATALLSGPATLPLFHWQNARSVGPSSPLPRACRCSVFARR